MMPDSSQKPDEVCLVLPAPVPSPSQQQQHQQYQHIHVPRYVNPNDMEDPYAYEDVGPDDESTDNEKSLKRKYIGLLILFSCLASGCVAIICFFSVFSPLNIQSRFVSHDDHIARNVVQSIMRLGASNPQENALSFKTSVSPRKVFHHDVFEMRFGPTENGIAPRYIHKFKGKFNERNVLVDIGANDGQDWALQGVKDNLVVYSFEPSMTKRELFMDTMKQNGLEQVALVRIPSEPLASDNQELVTKVKVSIPPVHLGKPKPYVYLIESSITDKNGVTKFNKNTCTTKGDCAKVNKHSNQHDDPEDTHVNVPALRFGNIQGIDGNKVWLFKFAIDGTELETLDGASDFLKSNDIPFVAMQFGGRSTVEGATDKDFVRRNVKVLERLYEAGYTCFHMRGNEKCPPGKMKSKDCLWNWATDSSNAPSFEDYSMNIVKTHGGHTDILCALSRTQSVV